VVSVREKTIPTERQPLVGEFNAKFKDKGCQVVSVTDPHSRILGFLDRSCYFFFQEMRFKKGKTILVTGRGCQQGSEMSMLPHFVDNWLTDGSEVVSVTCRPPFTPRKIPGTCFCQRLSRSQRQCVWKVKVSWKNQSTSQAIEPATFRLASASINYTTACPVQDRNLLCTFSSAFCSHTRNLHLWPHFICYCLNEMSTIFWEVMRVVTYWAKFTRNEKKNVLGNQRARIKQFEQLSIISSLKMEAVTKTSSTQRYCYPIKSYSVNRPWRPIGLWDVKDPTLFIQSAHS
jgi:hypothetical protein